MIIRPANRSLWLMLFTLKGSIVPAIWRQVTALTALAVLVVLMAHRLPYSGIELGAAPLTLMGLTLAIFLGFRNGAAYERWWEARKLWGELVIATRNLARQTQGFTAGVPVRRQRALVHRLVAFAHALRHRLRGSDPRGDLAHWLPPAEAAALAASPNPPNALLGMLGRDYAQLHREGHIDSVLYAAVDGQLASLSHVLGGCERIQGTPIPFAYILLLHRTVYMYCLLLPFCLVSAVNWFTPVMVAVLAYTFFGLDALGDQIEDPFGLLPNNLALDAHCRTIEISLGELLGEAPLPEPLAPRDGVLL